MTIVELKKTSSLLLAAGVNPVGTTLCAWHRPAKAATNRELAKYMMIEERRVRLRMVESEEVQSVQKTNHSLVISAKHCLRGLEALLRRSSTQCRTQTGWHIPLNPCPAILKRVSLEGSVKVAYHSDAPRHCTTPTWSVY